VTCFECSKYTNVNSAVRLCHRTERNTFPNVTRGAILPPMDNRSISDVGGTSGGLGQFLLGFAMACVGGFLITNQLALR
jgi:hypothetical protein